MEHFSSHSEGGTWVFFISFRVWDIECSSSPSEGGTQSVFHLIQRVEHRAFFISFRGWDTECFSSHPECGTWSVFHLIQRVGHGIQQSS